MFRTVTPYWTQRAAAASTLLMVLTLSGCRHDPNVQKRKYLESGQRYEKEGKYREAAIQFSNALKVDHNYAPAHYELAKTYIQLGSMIAGYQELQRTVSLDPGNLKARIDLGNMLAAGGLPDRAKEQVSAVLAAEPNNADAYALLSHIAQRQGDAQVALANIQHALQLDPHRAEFHTSLGLLEAQDPKTQAAGEQELEQAVSLLSQSPAPHMALAHLYFTQGNNQGAEQQLQAAIKAAPKDLQPRAALAELYVHEHQMPQAEQVLVQAVNDMPDQERPSALLLQFYGGTTNLGGADATFSTLHSSHKGSVPIGVQYSRVLILERKFDQASEVLKDLGKTNANNPQVEQLNADLLIHAGKTGDALTLLQKAVSEAPDDVRLRLVLAQTAASLGKMDIAETNLREAARLDPRNLDAARGLAAIASTRSDMSQLRELADKTIDIHPDSEEGYLWRGAVEAKQQDLAAADKDFQTALAKNPQDLRATLDLGELRFQQKRIADGRVLLEQVLARDQNQIQALNLLVAADLQDKQPEKALALMQAQLVKSPNNPVLYADLSALQLQLKDTPGSLASAQKALAINRAFEPAVQAYSEAELASGNTDAAIAAWQDWMKAHPDDPRATMLLGTLEESKGDATKAMDYYKHALELDSSQAVAANNLAYLMVQSGENTDVALSYAQTARRILPDSPSTADTLAWVYYHKGTYSLARDLLEDAMKASPGDAAIRYHLGLTYSKLNDKADAATQLKKAVELAPNTETSKDAAAALTQMGA